MKKIGILLGIILAVLCLVGCTKKQEEQGQGALLGAGAAEWVEAAETEQPGSEFAEITSEVFQDKKYNAAIIGIAPEDFCAAGFQLGDSCDIVFSNGYTLEDVPFFNGYYVRNEEPVIVAYPGFQNIRVTLNNVGIWETAGLKRKDTATITLNTAGKYSAVQEVLGQDYSVDRLAYETDEEFCNFRPLTGGALKENFLYRGASPVDDRRGRAALTDTLLEKHGIKYILDLADSEKNMLEYFNEDEFNSPYAGELYEYGSVSLLDMGSSFESDEYQQKLVKGLREMLGGEGPVYIHCMEGKDRTGFVCMLLEALAGASYTEMLDDYMLTYQNYYHVSKEKTPEKYQAIKWLYFDSFMSYLLGGEEDENVLMAADYTESAKQYLRSGGMTDAEIETLLSFICGE